MDDNQQKVDHVLKGFFEQNREKIHQAYIDFVLYNIDPKETLMKLVENKHEIHSDNK